MVEYPEHEKLQDVKSEAQACGDFVNWLEEQGLAICEFRETFQGEWVRHSFTLEKLLAKRFDIDLQKIEAEKQAMLKTLNPAFRVVS